MPKQQRSQHLRLSRLRVYAGAGLAPDRAEIDELLGEWFDASDTVSPVEDTGFPAGAVSPPLPCPALIETQQAEEGEE